MLLCLCRRLPSSTNSAAYQRLVSSTCHVRRSYVYCTWRSKRSQYAMEPDIDSESQFLPTPPAFDTPVRGVPVGILSWRLVGKTKMVWLPDGEKLLKIMFIRYDRIHERGRRTDIQTDRQTDTTWRHRPLLHSIARQKLFHHKHQEMCVKQASRLYLFGLLSFYCFVFVRFLLLCIRTPAAFLYE